MKTINGREPLRLLLIDDSQNDVGLIALAIGKYYHLTWERVETEASLIVALNDDWDAILCDYNLPRFNPERALEIVRTKARNTSVPFIVISGSIKEEDDVIELILKGASDFVTKDSNMRRLALIIKRETNRMRRVAARELKAEVRIRESYELTIEAWGRALELRDKYTEGHTRRVTDLSLRLALAMDIPRHDFVNLNRGALLHDIGKIGIPDAVLLKPDMLTTEEFEIMKMHPKRAREMLEGIVFLEPCICVPYCHHERWNGTGYPQRLKGSNNPWSLGNPSGTGIPLLARLFSVVDVYDALVSDRPYRPSWDKARAIAYILEESDITFDPQVVETFVNMMGRG